MYMCTVYPSLDVLCTVYKSLLNASHFPIVVRGRPFKFEGGLGGSFLVSKNFFFSNPVSRIFFSLLHVNALQDIFFSLLISLQDFFSSKKGHVFTYTKCICIYVVVIAVIVLIKYGAAKP